MKRHMIEGPPPETAGYNQLQKACKHRSSTGRLCAYSTTDGFDRRSPFQRLLEELFDVVLEHVCGSAYEYWPREREHCLQYEKIVTD